jgi:hypothetical protein
MPDAPRPTTTPAVPPVPDPDDDLMPPALAAELANEMCDACGSADTWWRNCKLLCRGCGGIVKSCADL